MTEEEKRKYNQEILDSYDLSDLTQPQVILRIVNQTDGNILDDELFKVSLTNFDGTLPPEFRQFCTSLIKFKNIYSKILNDPVEKTHLEALSHCGGRIIIENKCSNTNVNSKSNTYAGLSTTILGKPAVCLVGESGDTAFLHEIIHNSDLRFKNSPIPFSSLPLHHAAIMMIDTQKENDGDKNYFTTRLCKAIEQNYQPKQKYIEGLSWITELSINDLAQEKNHIGKHLKILHAIYTEALLKNQHAVLRCFHLWQPSEHIAPLLEIYDRQGQKAGSSRTKILKQQKHFWDQLLKFRKEINKLKVNGIECDQIDGRLIGRFMLVAEKKYPFPVFMAQKKARDLFAQNHSLADHTAQLKELVGGIKPQDINQESSFLEKSMCCLSYAYKIEEAYGNLPVTLNKIDGNQAPVVRRKQLYGLLKRYIIACEEKIRKEENTSEAERANARIALSAKQERSI